MSEEEKKAIECCNKYIEAGATIDYVDEIDGELRSVTATPSKIETVLNLIQNQQAELENKDKIIDEMAQYIGDEDITERFCNGKEYCDENCKQCVKQYFENKIAQ